jgi:hypothetical protein
MNTSTSRFAGKAAKAFRPLLYALAIGTATSLSASNITFYLSNWNPCPFSTLYVTVQTDCEDGGLWVEDSWDYLIVDDNDGYVAHAHFSSVPNIMGKVVLFAGDNCLPEDDFRYVDAIIAFHVDAGECYNGNGSITGGQFPTNWRWCFPYWWVTEHLSNFSQTGCRRHDPPDPSGPIQLTSFSAYDEYRRAFTTHDYVLDSGSSYCYSYVLQTFNLGQYDNDSGYSVMNDLPFTVTRTSTGGIVQTVSFLVTNQCTW